MTPSPSASDERPIFKVTTAPGFATGLKMYAPDEEIVWAVPPEWDEAKYGKHFAAYGPSLTFLPVNEAAEKLMVEHKAKIAKALAPKPTKDDARFEKLEAMHLQMMNALLEQQAENRRLREKMEELGEEKGKKK